MKTFIACISILTASELAMALAANADNSLSQASATASQTAPNSDSTSAPKIKTSDGGAKAAADAGNNSDLQELDQKSEDAAGLTTGDSPSADQVFNQVRNAIDMAMKTAGAAIKGANEATKDAMQSDLIPRIQEFQGNLKRLDHTTSREPAAVVVTRPMEAKDRLQLQEDLRVMDRVLSEQVARIEDKSAHDVLGIRVTRVHRSGEPMYLEDFGALFSYRANFPLTGSDNAAGTRDAADHSAQSAWDRAKSEIDSKADGDRDDDSIKRDGERLQKQLINAIIGVLPEAKHIRNLKEFEWVMVTVSGSDENSNPVRLTLKAKKSEIDRALNGGDSANLEKFKESVFWTVN